MNLSAPFQKRQPPFWAAVFLAEMERFACIFRRGAGAFERGRYRAKNSGVHQSADWFTHRPPACADRIRISPHPNRKPSRQAGFSVWRRWRDSNSRGAFDPYTISNRARSTNYATSPCCSRSLLFTCQPAYYNAEARQKSRNIFASVKNTIKETHTHGKRRGQTWI